MLVDRRRLSGLKAGCAILAAILSSACRGEQSNQATAAPTAPPGSSQTKQPIRQAEVDLIDGAGLLPPGTRIETREDVEGATVFGFSAREAPSRLAAWYRASQQAQQFELYSEMDEGAERVLSGTTRRPPGDFSVRLAPAPGGGTNGLVLLAPRR